MPTGRRSRSCPRRRSRRSTATRASSGMHVHGGHPSGDKLLQATAHIRRAGAPSITRQCGEESWGVPVDELTTEPGVVVHAKSGRRLSYGEIAAIADVPAKAPDIKPEQLKNAKRLPADRQGRDARGTAGKGQRHCPVQHRRASPGHALRRGAARAGGRRGPGQDRRGRGKAIAGVVRVVRCLTASACWPRRRGRRSTHAAPSEP